MYKTVVVVRGQASERKGIESVKNRTKKLTSKIERYSPLIDWENQHRQIILGQELCLGQFSRLFHSHKKHLLCSPFGPLLYTETLLYRFNSLPFHIPEARKRYPFLAKPSRIGHYEEYPPPPGTISAHSLQTPLYRTVNGYHILHLLKLNHLIFIFSKLTNFLFNRHY